MMGFADERLRVVIRRGDGSRTPLLLANGAGAGLEALQPFVDAMDESIEIIRFDAPGVGGSPNPTMPYRFHTLVRELGQLLDRRGYDQIDMLGFSWGSGLAQQFALENRRRCRRLVLVSSCAGTLMVPPIDPQLYLTMATPRRFHDPAYARRVIAAAYGGSSRENPDKAMEILYSKERQASGWRGYYYQLGASAGWTSLPWLSRLRQPTLILAGDDDPVLPPVNGRLLNRLIPNSRLQVYHGGHVALLTEATMMASFVEEFLAEAQD
jgi:poly(3-hydroxyalkanoate) depolymerase